MVSGIHVSHVANEQESLKRIPELRAIAHYFSLAVLRSRYPVQQIGGMEQRVKEIKVLNLKFYNDHMASTLGM